MSKDIATTSPNDKFAHSGPEPSSTASQQDLDAVVEY
jgi:hypothetical protein